jgi:hypothetical protein
LLWRPDHRQEIHHGKSPWILASLSAATTDTPMQLEWTSKPLHWMRDLLGSQGYLKFLDTELNSVIPLKQKRMP